MAIGQPLARCQEDRIFGPLAVGNIESRAAVVTELSKVAVLLYFASMLVDANHGVLGDREQALYRVVRAAARPSPQTSSQRYVLSSQQFLLVPVSSAILLA